MHTHKYTVCIYALMRVNFINFPKVLMYSSMYLFIGLCIRPFSYWLINIFSSLVYAFI